MSDKMNEVEMNAYHKGFEDGHEAGREAVKELEEFKNPWGEVLDPVEVKKALTAMHHGLLNMQARLDDHEKVIEKMMVVLDNLTSGRVPNGFRQPPKAK